MVYISELDKNIWPLYVPPLPDELFSSWFFRLSHKIDLKPEIFFKQCFNRRLDFGNNDIDMAADPEVLVFISKHTPLSIKGIKELFLESYESYVFECAGVKEIPKSIQLLKADSLNMRRNGLLICPRCLSKKTPYLRKKWRLSTSIICTECICYFIDHCPGCNVHISHRILNELLILNKHQAKIICKCGYDISEFSSPLIPSDLEIEYQEYINKTILNGYNDITQYSFTYLKILILIAFKLQKIAKIKLYQSNLKSIYPDLIINIEQPFERWSLLQRRHLLPIAYSLLKNFPGNIKNIFPKEQITRAEFGQLPYWFENELIFR